MVKKSSSTKATKGNPAPPQSQKQFTPSKHQKTGSEESLSRGGVSSYQRRSAGFATQQLILNIFSEAFAEQLGSDTFAATLQEVKQALFDRDFARAFGDEVYLGVYAARYSPTRALCYAEALLSISGHLNGLLANEHPRREPDSSGGFPPDSSQTTAADHSNSDNTKAPPPGADAEGADPIPIARMVSIGGGAAELVAFASYIRHHQQKRDKQSIVSGSLCLLDSGPWDAVVKTLLAGLTTPPKLSKYASAEARAANSAFIDPSLLQAVFIQGDVLSLGKGGLSDLFRFKQVAHQQQEPEQNEQQRKPLLITLLFTLNELFTSGGIGKTTTFLLGLKAAVPPGSLLLVVDSPGSYSETVVGKQSKKYPMHWLLDKVLLTSPIRTMEQPESSRCWTKVESHDSLWFRLSEALTYPIPLENMRYQMHLYKAVEQQSTGD